MPYYGCTKCHHEFEHIPYEGEGPPKCDWCGAKVRVLEKQTPLEKMCEELSSDPRRNS